MFFKFFIVLYCIFSITIYLTIVSSTSIHPLPTAITTLLSVSMRSFSFYFFAQSLYPHLSVLVNFVDHSLQEVYSLPYSIHVSSPLSPVSLSVPLDVPCQEDSHTVVGLKFPFRPSTPACTLAASFGHLLYSHDFSDQVLNGILQPTLSFLYIHLNISHSQIFHLPYSSLQSTCLYLYSMQ